ncbi:MAG: PD-(D/E)XK nuclease family protein [Bacteroidales bacterium]|nr:MAG: PD-(D/E)XK nuclease family protein [Bacteroidales bacterium]
MPCFLQDIAAQVFSTYKDDLSDICIVFPNKRARLYFNKYLSGLTDKPLWAPAYFTINELMEHLSGLQVADPVTRLFELYSSFKKVTQSPESFDSFYFYLEILLADFDDIDKNLVAPEDIFQNLAKIKNIENYYDYLTDDQIEIITRFWKTFVPASISEDQKDFLSLWESMYNIYAAFNEALRKKNLAYEGMAYREVINRINSNKLNNHNAEKYIIIGFNALNKCEKQLFRYLRNKGKAEFYWDYDDYYVNNTIHEAGYFLRDNIKEFPAPLSSLRHNNISKKEMEISFISVPSNIGQAKIISRCLKKIGKLQDIDIDKTAIILADENLLLPVLNSIPEEINDINVSMGYPFKETPVFSFIAKLVDIHRNSRTASNGKIQVYYKDVISLLKLPVLIDIIPEEISELTQKITSRNKVFINIDDLKSNDKLANVFLEIKDPKNIPAYILRILEVVMDSYKLKKADSGSEIKVELDFIYHAYTYIQRLKEMLEETGIEFSANTIFKLLINILKKLSIPFSGEPLAGLQVMGILETRTLDFDNVIILSLNEGIFPKSHNIPSFIPVSLRYGFELPVPEHQDAIYAYYFYRLMQRSKNIFLVYNSRTDGLFTGERSRFLHQIFYESVFNVTEESFSYDISPAAKKTITAKKNINESHNLKEYIKQDSKICLTPSAVNTFLNCSLRFYFRYIAELREPEEVIEDIDPAIFGSILHKSINIIYKPHINDLINKDILNKIAENKSIYESAINDAFLFEYYKEKDRKNNPDITGRNLIIKEVISKYVKQILDIDMLYSPFRIISLEKYYTAYLPVEINNNPEKVRIGGIIDRIDEKDGKIRIVDYKTGQAENSFKSIDSLFDEKGSERNSAVFQTLMYSLIYSYNNRESEIIPTLYVIREAFAKDFDFRIILHKGRKDSQPVNSYRVLSEEFSHRLKQTLEDLYNDKMIFTQTDDPKVCTFCPYAGICHKEEV